MPPRAAGSLAQGLARELARRCGFRLRRRNEKPLSLSLSLSLFLAKITACRRPRRCRLPWRPSSSMNRGTLSFLRWRSARGRTTMKGRAPHGSLTACSGGTKCATSVNIQLLRLQSSEGKFTMSREIEPIRRSFSIHRSGTFTEVARLVPSDVSWGALHV